jgi:predicted acylesterase/phospholipase RssA
MDANIEQIKNIENFDTLVLAGGGAKGILTLGALQYAFDNLCLNNIKNYIGTSAGAMICFLLCIGYTPIEIIVYICTHHLLERIQHFNILGMINGLGASSFVTIQEELERMTISKIGFLPTLKDIYNRYGKNLICCTYNITLNKTEYISYENNPDLPCIIALKMSSNLPLIFENFLYNGNLYIDGGIGDNFPIDIGDTIGEKVLGILINNNIEIFNNGSSDIDIIEYIYYLFFIPSMQSIESKINKVSNKCKIVRLSYEKIKFFTFNIESKIKLDMFSIGYNLMKIILENP